MKFNLNETGPLISEKITTIFNIKFKYSSLPLGWTQLYLKRDWNYNVVIMKKLKRYQNFFSQK